MKNIVYFLAFICSLQVICSCNGATIYKTAYLTRKGNGFVITLRGKGVGHPAGPLDVIFPKTYDDSMQYQIPRDIGIIKGEELPYDSCCYRSTGTITVEKEKLKIDLFYRNTDDKRLDAGTWNGQYDLVRIK